MEKRHSPPRLPARAAAVSADALVRVTYRDTDKMGHAYYANYLVWFEIGRTELLRSMGRSYRQWEDEEGVFLPVSACWVDYKKGARYDEMVRIRVTIGQLTRATIEFRYTLTNDATGELLATGGDASPVFGGRRPGGTGGRPPATRVLRLTALAHRA